MAGAMQVHIADLQEFSLRVKERTVWRVFVLLKLNAGILGGILNFSAQRKFLEIEV
jgi:hypothetical protein